MDSTLTRPGPTCHSESGHPVPAPPKSSVALGPKSGALLAAPDDVIERRYSAVGNHGVRDSGVVPSWCLPGAPIEAGRVGSWPTTPTFSEHGAFDLPPWNGIVELGRWFLQLEAGLLAVEGGGMKRTGYLTAERSLALGNGIFLGTYAVAVVSRWLIFGHSFAIAGSFLTIPLFVAAIVLFLLTRRYVKLTRAR